MKKYHVCQTKEDLLQVGKKLQKNFLVVFVTNNCYPCEKQEEAIGLYSPKFDIDIVIINVTEQQKTAHDFNVYSSPEMIVLDHNCNIIDNVKGCVEPESLDNFLKAHFDK